MFISKRVFLSVNLASILLCHSMVGYSATIPHSKKTDDTQLPVKPANESAINKSSFYIDFLYIKPASDNLKYATFVSGTQPYFQSWHYQEITPNYHPAIELGLNYAIPDTLYSAGASWTYLNSNDSSSKNASTNTDLSTVEFVGPPYEMSPPVFGIKSVNSRVNFNYNNILLNIGKLTEYSSRLQTRIFGGIDILNLDQKITTTFGNYAGSPATAYSYALPPDPLFSFETQNVSKYLGAGPAVGMSFQYKMDSGLGVMGDVLGLLTAGTSKTQDNFTSTSTRLTLVGIGTSHQEITSPNDTQVVFGADAKLGVFYKYQGTKLPNFIIEAGYRIATYINAISTISPNTLVQPGTVVATPEFATGTMAIVSTNSKNSPFSFNGAFLNVKIDVA
ncbi:MAG: Lpg1974 family pore-forming outer membrane protein [Gammaproteobacteria bacterium]